MIEESRSTLDTRHSRTSKKEPKTLTIPRGRRDSGPSRHPVKTKTRAKPDRVKEQIVVDREYTNLVLKSEDVAEFDYQPTACSQSYRMIVIRKHIDEMKGQKLLLNKERFLFYITNDRTSTPEQIVFTCNDRC